MPTYKRPASQLRPSRLRNMSDPETGKKYKKIWVESTPKPVLADIKPNDLGNYVPKNNNQ